MPSRRRFIKNVSATSVAVAISTTPFFARDFAIKNKIRLGLIGTGLREQGHINLLLKRKDVKIACICDVDDVMLASARKLFSTASAKLPKYLQVIITPTAIAGGKGFRCYFNCNAMGMAYTHDTGRYKSRDKIYCK